MHYFQIVKKERSTLFIFSVSFLFITSMYGCSKESIEVATISNPPLTIHISKVLDIRASDVLNTSSSIKRKIEYIDRITKLVLDSFIISIVSTDTNSILYSAIKNKTFNGSVTIESGPELLLNIDIYKGVVSKNNSINENKNINLHNYKSNLVNTCKVGLIHGCVSNAIDNMGVFEYAACLYSAPSCYALLWAGCGFNYCVTGEQK